MKQRVMSRYFEDVSVMLTINMMTFVFRLILGAALAYFTIQHWSTQVVSNAVDLVVSNPPDALTTAVLLLPALLGAVLAVGLFTRIAALVSVIANLVGTTVLAIAWAKDVDLYGSNSTDQVFDPVMSYLPQMTYNLGFVLLALFLLVVPVYALEFQSLDGKIFPTPIEKKETDE